MSTRWMPANRANSSAVRCLEWFCQAHVVSQHGATSTDGEGDAIQLIGQQLGLKETFAQWMPGRILPDLGRLFGKASLQGTMWMNLQHRDKC